MSGGENAGPGLPAWFSEDSAGPATYAVDAEPVPADGAASSERTSPHWFGDVFDGSRAGAAGCIEEPADPGIFGHDLGFEIGESAERISGTLGEPDDGEGAEQL